MRSSLPCMTQVSIISLPYFKHLIIKVFTALPWWLDTWNLRYWRNISILRAWHYYFFKCAVMSNTDKLFLSSEAHPSQCLVWEVSICSASPKFEALHYRSVICYNSVMFLHLKPEMLKKNLAESLILSSLQVCCDDCYWQLCLSSGAACEPNSQQTSISVARYLPQRLVSWSVVFVAVIYTSVMKINLCWQRWFWTLSLINDVFSVWSLYWFNLKCCLLLFQGTVLLQVEWSAV